MKYTRLYADPDGETHFEDVDVEFSGGTVSTRQEVSDCFFAEPNFEAFTDYHTTPRKQWLIRLSGLFEIGASDGEVRRFSPGDAILLDDMDSKGHITRTIGPGNGFLVGLEE